MYTLRPSPLTAPATMEEPPASPLRVSILAADISDSMRQTAAPALFGINEDTDAAPPAVAPIRGARPSRCVPDAGNEDPSSPPRGDGSSFPARWTRAVAPEMRNGPIRD
ncbi:hypothetical protein GCM10009761_29760 [Agromyces terreus]